MQDLLGSGLIQQIPVAVILVYAMRQFLQHLSERDRTLSTSIVEFTAAVRAMASEMSKLNSSVTKLDQKFRG